MSMASMLDKVRDYVRRERLKSFGIVWLGGLTASMAFQWTRPIPTQMKIINTRVYAQAFTLAALAGAAVMHLGEEEGGSRSPGA